MKQSLSWEARLLQMLKLHYHVHNNPSMDPIVSHMNPVHTFPPHFPKTHSDIFPSTSRSSAWSFPFRFSDQNVVWISYCYILQSMYKSLKGFSMLCVFRNVMYVPAINLKYFMLQSRMQDWVIFFSFVFSFAQVTRRVWILWMILRKFTLINNQPLNEFRSRSLQNVVVDSHLSISKWLF
jgi:hypothetical protein